MSGSVTDGMPASLQQSGGVPGVLHDQNVAMKQGVLSTIVG